MPFRHSPYLLVRGTLAWMRFDLRTLRPFGKTQDSARRSAAGTDQRLARSREKLQKLALRTRLYSRPVEQAGRELGELKAQFRLGIHEFARTRSGVDH